MTLVIFDGNTNNYTILNKKDDECKVELIKIQTDDNNNESSIIKQNKPKVSKKTKTRLTKKNKEFLNSLTKVPTVAKQSKPKNPLKYYLHIK